MHPIIQVVSKEWEQAENEGRLPNWGLFTPTYIEKHCDIMKAQRPKCHPDLYATNLTGYLQGLPERRKWWILESAASMDSGDGPLSVLLVLCLSTAHSTAAYIL